MKVEYPNEQSHSLDKFILKIEPLKTNVQGIYVVVADAGINIDYTAKEGQIIIVDLTDCMQALSPANIDYSIMAYGVTTSTVLDRLDTSVNMFKGFAVNEEIYPLKRAVVCDSSYTFPTTVKIHQNAILEKWNNELDEWEVLEQIEATLWSSMDLEPGKYRISPDPEDEDAPEMEVYGFDINIADECELSNAIHLTWLSENGYEKSWYFNIAKEIRKYTSSIELSQPTNGYNVVKNKAIEYEISQLQADMELRQYIADIVYSSEVKAYYHDETGDKIIVPVSISDKSISIDFNKKYEDISLTLNMSQYDIF